MITNFLAVAWTKQDRYGQRGWDISWTDSSDIRKREQCFFTIEASLVQSLAGNGHAAEVRVPRHLQ